MKRVFRQLSIVKLFKQFAAVLIWLGRLEHAVYLRWKRTGVRWLKWLIVLAVPIVAFVKYANQIKVYFRDLPLSWRDRATQARLRRQMLRRQRQVLALVTKKQRIERQHLRRAAIKDLYASPFKNLFKPVLAFSILLLLIITPVKFYDGYRFLRKIEAKVMNFSSAALGQIDQAKSAAESNNFESASLSFSQASQDFVKIGQELSSVDGLVFRLANLAPSDKLKLAALGPKLADIGQLGTELAAQLSASADALMNDRNGKNFSQVLDDFSITATSAYDKLQALNQILISIDEADLPADYRVVFVDLKAKTAVLKLSLQELLDVADKLQIFLGQDIDKRYLMVFQNNTEARATGGFMGSFALIDFKQGQIKKMHSPGGGTYDTEGGLRRLVQAPRPMWLVNPLWHMWDANWWPDWPKSARKIMWFYEKSDGSTVDGVISLTPNVVIKLLEVVGPIDLSKKHQVIITSENFIDTVQAIAEQKPDVTTEPKQIIGDMLQEIMDRLAKQTTRDEWLKLIKILEASLNERDILIYLTDTALQNKLVDLGWDGGLRETSGDYLAVINTNIAGGKSDKKIIQTIRHEASITTDGSIIDTVTIVRDHQAIKREPFCGVRNVNWIRVYVPLGSRLISSEGWRQPDVTIEGPDPAWEFDPELKNEAEATKDEATQTISYREQDKTVFANWSMVDPGEMAVIKLVYKLPFEVKLHQAAPSQVYSKYTLLVQKQAGSHNSEISSNLILPATMKVQWHYPEQHVDGYYQQNTDRYWAYLISKNN